MKRKYTVRDLSEELTQESRGFTKEEVESWNSMLDKIFEFKERTKVHLKNTFIFEKKTQQ